MNQADRLGFWASLSKLYGATSADRRRQFYFVLVLMIFGAFAELATIGAVLPFLTLLADPGSLDRFPVLTAFLDAVGAATSQEKLVAVTALFIFVAIVSGLIRLQLLWSSQSLVFGLGHELSVEIQRRILLQPYDFHVRTNTSRLIASLDKVHSLVWNVLLPLMQMFAAIFISMFIIAALIFVDPLTALVAAGAFAAIYVLISALTRSRLARNSAIIGPAYDERVKLVQESLGGIRDVIIDSAQAVFLNTFRRVDGRLNIARANTAFIGAAPRFVIEAFGMVFIALLAIALAQSGGVAEAIPVLGALALGAQRLLPLLQQIYTGWTLVTAHSSVTADVSTLLSLPLPTRSGETINREPLVFDHCIRLSHVSFSYGGRRSNVLEDVSFAIRRGSTIGLIGRTGSGKSTLADLLMALLQPTQGEITVDGVPLNKNSRERWWRSIAHVPQAIFLADETIARNIAFGVPAGAIDMEQVMMAAKEAQLHEFILSLPDAYHTEVGERGIRLSGGQRQRLGLARAIYKHAPVLFLDEATSALDDETEAAVMTSLRGLSEQGRTVIIIAHRLSTVSACDTVVRLENGRIADIGSFSDVVLKRGNSLNLAER